MTKEEDEEALEIEAAIDNLKPTDEVEKDLDVLLEVTGKLTYPQFIKWTNVDIAGVTLKANETGNDMTMIIHAKDGGSELVLRAFGGNCDDIRIPAIMRTYVMHREWYSRLDTEPCVDLLVYNDEKAEFALILVDMDYQMLIFPGFTWTAPIELVDDWLAKRAERAYRTTFEFSDVAAWLDHEITNKDLQPGLFLNYKDGPSICISGTGTSKLEEISLVEQKVPKVPQKQNKEVKVKVKVKVKGKGKGE